MKLFQRIIVNGLVITGLVGLISYKPSNALQINYESKSNILEVSNPVYKGTATADVGGKSNCCSGYKQEKLIAQKYW